jgi:hypothetical protein
MGQTVKNAEMKSHNRHVVYKHDIITMTWRGGLLSKKIGKGEKNYE